MEEREALADGLERSLGVTLEVGQVFLVIPNSLDVGLILGRIFLGLAGNTLKGIDHLVENPDPLLARHVQARCALTMLLENHQTGQDESGNGHIQVIEFLDIYRQGDSFGIEIVVHNHQV